MVAATMPPFRKHPASCWASPAIAVHVASSWLSRADEPIASDLHHHVKSLSGP
jgi:hypothetical protein